MIGSLSSSSGRNRSCKRLPFTIPTATGSWTICGFTGTIARAQVRTDYELFSLKCLKGCPNYDQKHSCPPRSPSFDTFPPHKPWLHVICLRMGLDQFPFFNNPYHRVRMANAMLKPRLTRILMQWKSLNPRDSVLGSGACRACRRCAALDQLPCRKPAKGLYSLEATGVNCAHLVKTCFGLDLEWYLPGRPCSHGLVVGGILSERQRMSSLSELIVASI